MKKRLALGLAAVLAVSSLTACNNESPTESELREQIAQLESELDKVQGNSDNTESNSTDAASNAPSEISIINDHGGNMHVDPDGHPEVSEPEQGYQYPDMFDVLPYIDEAPASKFEYKYNSSLRGMEITSYKAQSPKIRVPDTIEGEPVVKVDLGKFSGATHLYLPDTVTEVVSDSSCWGLEYTNIPSAFNWDKDWFFEYSKDLISVYFDNGITEIGNSYDYIFYDDFKGVRQFDAMTTITIPDTVTKSSKYDFYGCKNATIIYKGKTYSYNELSTLIDDINYPDGIKIVNSVLQSVKEEYIGDLIIPEGVTEIADAACRDCTGITSIIIPNSVKLIGDYAFRGCTGLTSVTIPDSVTSIGDNTFNVCTGLTSITIPGSVTSIGYYDFAGCTGLTSVTIPDSVTIIKGYAFAGCTGLTSVTIPDSVTEINISAFSGCTGLTSVTIPDSVTEINNAVFDGCTGLTSITIPDSVTAIRDFAFHGCTGLTSITIPDNVTEIGERAFYGCTGLTSVTIPDSVTSIGYCAFSRCTGLTSVTIPDSVTKIEWAFDGSENIIATYKGKTYTYDQKSDLYDAING